MIGTTGRSVAESRSSVVRLMVPTDANFTGNVFGGTILNEIDRVAYVVAMRHSRAHTCVTASFDQVDFIAPVHVGDLVEVTGEISGVGRTAMEVFVTVMAAGIRGEPRRLVMQGHVTMAALDSDGRPTPVPTVEPASEEERRNLEAGAARMAARRAAHQRRQSVSGGS